MCERDYDSRLALFQLENFGHITCESCGESTDDGRLTADDFKPVVKTDGRGEYIKVLCVDCIRWEG